MPHLRFRGCDELLLEKLTPGLVARLADDIGCPPDWITVESVAIRYFTISAPLFAEVVWFDRGDAVRDRVANSIGEVFAAHGSTSVPTLCFMPVSPSNYYEDGRHY